MHLENTVAGLLTFLLEVLLRCFSALVKQRSFLSQVLLPWRMDPLLSLAAKWETQELPPKTELY